MRFLATILLITATATANAGEREELLRHLPMVDNRSIADAFTDPWTLWYTDEEMPPAYQHDSDISGQTTFHSARYDMSGGADEKRGLGNANNEFPWFHPGGTDRANVRTLRALSLPTHDGRMVPVVCFAKVDRTASNPNPLKRRLSWRFPRGAQLFEVLFMTGPDGNPWPFEVRMRYRLESSWDTALFRPVPTRDDLLEEFEFDVQRTEHKRVTATHPRETVFDVAAGWETLPLLDPQDVQRLLSRPFVETTGTPWSDVAAAPTSVQRFSLVPEKYDGTLVGTDAQSCARCHEHVARHVTAMDPARDWYGYVRGSDGIFSFLPVDPSCVSRDGNQHQVRLQPALVKSGYIAFLSAEPQAAPYAPLGDQ